MMQKSVSSSDGGVVCAGLARLVSRVARFGGGRFGVAFFGVAFFAALVAFAVAFSFKMEIFSGEVSSALCIGFRPRFDGFFGVAVCRGPISFKIDELLVGKDITDTDREVDGSDVNTSSSRPMSMVTFKTIRRCSSSARPASKATDCPFCSTACTKSASVKMSGLKGAMPVAEKPDLIIFGVKAKSRVAHTRPAICRISKT